MHCSGRCPRWKNCWCAGVAPITVHCWRGCRSCCPRCAYAPRTNTACRRTGWQPWPSPGSRMAAWKACPPPGRAWPAPAVQGCSAPSIRRKTGANATAAPGRSRTRRPSFSRSLDGEGLAAPAGGAGVRVVDHEARALEALLVIHFGAGEILETHRIDHQADALAFDDGIVVGDFFIEREAVLKAGAAATGHEHPEHQARIAFFLDQALHLLRRPLREDQRGGGEGFNTHAGILPASSQTTWPALSAYPSKAVNYSLQLPRVPAARAARPLHGWRKDGLRPGRPWPSPSARSRGCRA